MSISAIILYLSYNNNNDINCGIGRGLGSVDDIDRVSCFGTTSQSINR
ncbi:unnamed protein product, partial [Rotaria sordida]